MAVTANRSYPYPIASDSPAGHTQIQALATAVDVDITNLFFGAWLTYVPAWTSSGVAPVLNNGTIAGSYHQVGKKVVARGELVMGTTTTYGSGSYKITVPFAASVTSQAQGVGSLWMLDNGTQTKVGTCSFVDATNLWLVAASGGDVSTTNPHTWAVADRLRWQIVYEVP